MIKAILNGILKALVSVVNFLLTPLNLVFTKLLKVAIALLISGNKFVNTYIGNSLSYFFSILPPIFRGLLILWFTFIIAYYTIYYTYVAILKIFNIIQKIKFW